MTPLRQKPAMTLELAEAKCPDGTRVLAEQGSHSCRVATILPLYGLLCGMKNQTMNTIHRELDSVFPFA